MNRTVRLIVVVLLILIISVSAIQIVQRLFGSWRIDVTQEKLYTLSEGTRNILQALQQPLTLRLYYTKTATLSAPDQIRFFNAYYEYVRALLEEYVLHSNGKIKLEIVDPRPYSQEELAAIRYGLKRFSITEEESFFFGLVVQTELGVTKTIPFFSPDRENFIEYDITYLIDTAVNPPKTRVGILSSLPVMGDDMSGYMAAMMRMQGQRPRGPWGLVRQLKELYADVRSIPTDTEEIRDVDLLLVIHPKDLPAKTRYAIDQYILKGGRAVIALDPFSVVDRPDPAMMQYGMEHKAASSLDDLLSAWGLEMPANTFAGDRVLAGIGSPSPNERPMKILPYQKLTASYGCFNKDVPMTASLNEVTFWFPGVLKKKKDAANLPADMEYIPLMMTTKQGNTWTISSPFDLRVPDYADILRRFRDGTEEQVLAYRVTGTFRSAFPDGPPKEEKKEEGKEDNKEENKDENKDASSEETKPAAEHLSEARQPAAVVVVADVDFLSDVLAYQETIFGLAVVGNNAAFVLNALEELSGSTDLIRLRSRGGYKRPFTRVDQIEKEAEEKTAEEETRIMAEIKGFESQLNEKLRALESKEKELINKTILEEKKEIELKLHEAEMRLRDVKMKKVADKEALKNRIRNFCTLPGPLAVLTAAVVLAVYRAVKRRYSIQHMREP
ncbi:MAG TPA: GldG family protein [Anaerohalosphaeraceae bacterium]|nr:GldG family protein [Anaerohalosphaeraceae bacterium]HOL89562.1 GldG family protein [Anaerohalosphaeraceae bacterium]HPP57308.1 GldG family protein [Anaerohalosphaeraceae bacterium]